MEITTEMKVLGGILIATVVIIVGGALLVGGNGASTDEPVAAEILVRNTSPTLGPFDAKVSVVEFGDFECPSCGALHGLLKQVKEQYKDQSVRFVYRNFPLPQHPNAQSAAEAAVAAQQQGKFWEYHDQLFEHQQALTRADLEKYAEAVGLDLAAFKRALDEKIYRSQVLDDQGDGRAARVTSTPTLFINGVRFNGQFNVAGLAAAIDEHLK